MLIPLYLRQYKYVKTVFKHLPPYVIMYWKIFECLFRRNSSYMHSIFNTVHAMSDMNESIQASISRHLKNIHES